jgi:hypothetical protein
MGLSRRTLGTLVAALAFFFLVPPALADQVKPSERVIAKPKTRGEVNSKGAVVGYVKVAEKAVLARDFPRAIRLYQKACDGGQADAACLQARSLDS